MLTYLMENIIECNGDVAWVTLSPPQRGFSITFTFLPNPFFSNRTLTKTFEVDPDDPEMVKATSATKVDWREGMDITHRKPTADKADAKRPPRARPCPSFFWLFDAAGASMLLAENGRALQASAPVLREREGALGFALRDEVIPHAYELYAQAAEWDEGEAGSGSGNEDDDISSDDGASDRFVLLDKVRYE
eukprot:jgi/Mesvir1/14554/Mv05236-RA.1